MISQHTTRLKVTFLLGWRQRDPIQGLEHDHGQTDSRARAQRLSAAHHKVTWSILIGFKYSTARVKQRLPVCKGKGHCKQTCQCSENSYFWRVKDHKCQAPCWVFLISTYIPQHVTLSCVLCVEIKTTFFHCSHISYAIIKADPIDRQHF